MGNSTPLPSDDARMVAWREYTATDDYRNTKRWAVEPPHTEGSLWAAFLAGWSGAESRTPNAPNALTALAEACDEAADYCGEVSQANEYWRGRRDHMIDDPKRCAAQMRALARALREGRVTISEEESPDA